MSTNLVERPSSSVSRPISSDLTDGQKTGRSDYDAIIETHGSKYVSWGNVQWGVVTWMVLMHAGCLAAPFFFTWEALGIAVVLHWLTCSLGVCLCYHRYLSHRSFKLVKPAEFVAVLCAVLSGEGSPLSWTATHRLHHQRSDRAGDPHTPLEGAWWSHLYWLFFGRPKDVQQAMYERFVPDLLSNPIMTFFDRTYGWWLVLSGALLFLAGGLPFLLWGLCVRMVVAYHSTWLVNSATHIWGYRSYETADESRNLWWVALVSYGEGWHNNHHAHPRAARAGHRWWEIDMTYSLIRVLRATGLAYDVNDVIPKKGAAATES